MNWIYKQEGPLWTAEFWIGDTEPAVVVQGMDSEAAAVQALSEAINEWAKEAS